MLRLGPTVASLKLKGIDGGLYKRWNMWFNSTLLAESYQSLLFFREYTLSEFSFIFIIYTDKGWIFTGVAWLSSACALRCLVRSRNERNP